MPFLLMSEPSTIDRVNSSFVDFLHLQKAAACTIVSCRCRQLFSIAVYL